MKFAGVVLALVLLGAATCVQADVFFNNFTGSSYTSPSHFSGVTARGPYGWLGVGAVHGATNSWELYRKFSGGTVAVNVANNVGEPHQGGRDSL